MSDLREQLAALIHLQWRLYMGYHLEQCGKSGEGGYILSPDYYASLRRLVGTSYDMLSEADKDKDRREADKVLALPGIVAMRVALDAVVTDEKEDPCYYDHHGYCQAHGLQPKGECYMELARIALKAVESNV